MRLAMYIVGQEETVGESAVSSGCWGEDSDHEYEWARALPRLRPFAFLIDRINTINKIVFDC